jgi:transposase
MSERKPYPSDVSDAEWAFVAPYPTLMDPNAPQREHSLREVFNGLRYIIRSGATWRMMPNDLPPWAAVYQQSQRGHAAGAFEAMVDDLRTVLRLVKELAYVDAGYTGEDAADDAAQHGIQLQVAKLPEAKKGFVLLPKRWVVERSFAWTARFRRLARDYERLASSLAALHYVAFAMLMLSQLARSLVSS